MIIRIGFIIGMFISYNKIFCRVGINSYIPIHSTIIKDEMKIRVEGSIYPVRAFLSEKCDLMYSMRFFSPKVNVNYSLWVTINREGKMVISFKRNYNMDTLHDTKMPHKENIMQIGIEGGKKSTPYPVGYHQTLIELFPSSTGDLNIYTSRKDSFIRFLEFEHVRKHKIDILACLFLLAEGVDIPLKVEGSKSSPMLVLKEIIAKPTEKNKTKNPNEDTFDNFNKTKKETNKFSLSMKDQCSEKKVNEKRKKNTVPQERAADVINFFIDNKENPDIREGGKYAEPTTYEEFKTGKFLNNSRWLIQYYIFEYLDSEDSIIEFAMAVYSMLKECIEKKTSEKGDESNEEVQYLKKVLNKCFVKSNDDADSDWRMCVLNFLYGDTSLERVFPFSSNMHVPIYRCVPSYNRKENKIDYAKMYSNCVETGLFGLFCCLAYDPETKEYTTEHMGNVSSDLKRFFAMHNKPFETDTYEMHREWSKVVADIENENIRYLKENRNELAPGIINMLYVIAEITGRYSEEEKSLKELSTLLEEEGNENQSELFTKVELYTEKLILSLSKTYTAEEQAHSELNSASNVNNGDSESNELVSRKIEFDFLNMHKTLGMDRGFDVFGEIFILYSFSMLKGGIKLDHSAKHLFIKSFPEQAATLTSSRIDTINNIIEFIKRNGSNTLTDYMFLHCAEKAVDNEGAERTSKNPHLENIRIEDEKKDSYPIEKTFLYNTFKNSDYSNDMIPYLRLCFLEYDLKKTDPWVRVISNIIGSLPLNDENVVHKLFFNPVYSQVYKNYCDKVNISLEILNNYLCVDESSYDYYLYIKNSSSLKGHLKLIKIYLVSGKHVEQFFSSVIERFVLETKENFLSTLSHNGTSIAPLLEIEEFLNKLDRTIPWYETCPTANNMRMLWLKISFNSDKFNYVNKMLSNKILIDKNSIAIDNIHQKQSTVIEE
ncbi:hypothetical protein NEIRO03_2394 [Nematocida sp. AWRm78]|nr:hypothetical protein NEIRO02_2379 [Nematocida sp. AWRm79]KAI5186809.1 hypothetical protein NEIRO03_2394 [Nematocida sp. AWRm78]